MKIVVIGGTGLIGSKTVPILRQGGHEVVAASPRNGINSITGEGLKEAMAGAQVVIDLSNSPSFEDKAVLDFFETSGRNLLAAESAADVRSHVALSIVGIDRMPDNGYFLAKVAQEKLIEASGIPYTIIRATQFFEFLGGIAATSTDGNVVRLSPGLFQPIAADDVAVIVADVALAEPRNGIVEIAGPERAMFNEIVARYLKAAGDPREVVSDPAAQYFGGRVEERSLVPLGKARLGRIGFDEWLRCSQAAPQRRQAMTDISKAGTFTLGDRTVNRLGYGAMQLAGPGVFGPPKDRERGARGAARGGRERRQSHRHERLLRAARHQPAHPRGAASLSERSGDRHQDRRPARRGRIVDPGSLAQAS